MFERRDREETLGLGAFGLLSATAVALLASAGPSLAETVGFETGLFPPGFSWTAEKGTCSVVPRASLPPWPECRQFVEQLSGNVLRCQLETAGGKVRFSLGGPSQDVSVRVLSPLQRGDCGSPNLWQFGFVGVSVWAPALAPGFYFWDGDYSNGLRVGWGDGSDKFAWLGQLVTRFDVEARDSGGTSQQIVIDSISYRPRLPPSVRILTPPLTEIRNGQRFEWETGRDPHHGFLVSVDDPLSDSPGSSQLSSPDLMGAWAIDPRLGTNGKVLYWIRPSARSVEVPNMYYEGFPVRFTVYAADDASYPLGVSQLLVPPPRILPASTTVGTVTAGAASAEFRVRLRNPSPLNVYGRVAVGAPAEIPVGGAGYLDFLPGAELEARLKFPASALVTPRQITSYISIRSSITYLGEVGRIPFTLNVVGPAVPSSALPSPVSDTLSISTGAAGAERPVDLSLAAGASLEVAPQFSDSETFLSASSVATPGGTLQATLAIRPGNTVAGRQLFVLRSPGTEGSKTLDTHWLNVDALQSRPVEECRRLGPVDIIPSAVSAAGLNGSQFFTDGWGSSTRPARAPRSLSSIRPTIDREDVSPSPLPQERRSVCSTSSAPGWLIPARAFSRFAPRARPRRSAWSTFAHGPTGRPTPDTVAQSQRASSGSNSLS
ncbi:MAG: hypothetical protein IPN83_23230 [Holophagales bacterium]|nr:hypothetical protein [Holophagales bacterium]